MTPNHLYVSWSPSISLTAKPDSPYRTNSQARGHSSPSTFYALLNDLFCLSEVFKYRRFISLNDASRSPGRMFGIKLSGIIFKVEMVQVADIFVAVVP